MKKIFNTAALLLISVGSLFSQSVPYLIGINQLVGEYNESVIISGIDFSSNPAENLVLFGKGRAEIISATPNALEVLVPANATYGPVQVTNLTTGLTAFTSENFQLAFGRSNFTANSVVGLVSSPTNQRNTYDLCLCDFNRNGRLDIAVSNQEPAPNTEPIVSIFANNSTIGNLSFTRSNLTLLPNNPMPTINVECGDLDGDGLPDLVFTEEIRPGLVRAANGVIILRNTSSGGNISFAQGVRFEIPNRANGDFRDSRRIAINDIDKDGKPEIIVTNTADPTLYVFKNTSSTGAISFESAPLQLEIPGGGNNFTLGLGVEDLNKDGFPEIVVTQFQAANFFVFTNRSSPGNISLSNAATINVAGNFLNLKIGDLNGDGIKDVALTNPTQNNVTIVPNTTTGSTVTFGTPVTVATNNSPWGLDLGDINGDGRLDIVVSSLSVSNLAYSNLINTSENGTLSFTRVNKPVSSNTRNIKLGDLDNDGRVDVATTGFETSSLLTLLNKNCIIPEITPDDQILCSGNEVVLRTVNNPTATYAWFRDGNQIAGATGHTYTASQSGQYTVRIITDGNGCSITSPEPAIINVLAGTSVVPTINPVGTVCIGETLTLRTNITGTEYFWKGPGGFEGTGNPLVIEDFSADRVGTYTLQIQSGACLSSEAAIRVTMESVPAINITNEGSAIVCVGSSTTLNATAFPGYTYQWQRDGQNIPNSNSTSLQITESGSYTASISGDNGCTLFSEPLQFNQVAPPTSAFSSADSICFNQPLTFNASSTGDPNFNLQYNWDFGDGKSGTGAQPTNTFTTPGRYTVTLTTGYNQLSGCSAQFTKTITVTDLPNISIGTPQGTLKCPNESITLTLPDNLQSYNWNTGSTSNTTEISQPGTYSVQARDAYGCLFNEQIIIRDFEDSGLTLTSSNSQLENDTIFMEEDQKRVDLSVSAGTNFNWLPEELFLDPTASTVSIYPREINTLLTVTGNDVNGCEESASVRIINTFVTPRTSFSPNGDGFGKECWEITNTRTLEGCQVFVFDNRGRNLLIASSPFESDCIWDGTVEGLQAPPGVYFFVMKCDDTDFNRSGSIMLAR